MCAVSGAVNAPEDLPLGAAQWWLVPAVLHHRDGCFLEAMPSLSRFISMNRSPLHSGDTSRSLGSTGLSEDSSGRDRSPEWRVGPGTVFHPSTRRCPTTLSPPTVTAALSPKAGLRTPTPLACTERPYTAHWPPGCRDGQKPPKAERKAGRQPTSGPRPRVPPRMPVDPMPLWPPHPRCQQLPWGPAAFCPQSLPTLDREDADEYPCVHCPTRGRRQRGWVGFPRSVCVLTGALFCRLGVCTLLEAFWVLRA